MMTKRTKQIVINCKKFMLEYSRGQFNIIKDDKASNTIEYYTDEYMWVFNWMFQSDSAEFVNIAHETNRSFMKSQIATPKKGKVYLVSDGQFVKIGGTTNNLQKRINELQTGNPRKLNLLGSYTVSYLLQSERMVQDLYKDRNVLNEWFDLGVQDINYILTEKIKFIEKNKPRPLHSIEIINIMEAQKDLLYDEYIYKLKLIKRQHNKLSSFTYSKDHLQRIFNLKNKNTANEYIKKYDVDNHMVVMKAIEKYEKEIRWLIDYMDYVNDNLIKFLNENNIYFDDDLGHYVFDSEVA